MLSVVNRFLPAIEALFVANTNTIDENENENENETTKKKSSSSSSSKNKDIEAKSELVDFVESYRNLLNACIRQNPSLMISNNGTLNVLARNYRCRPFLDFDNKRRYFREKIKHLPGRRQATEVGVSVRRKHIFTDSVNRIREMKSKALLGRLKISFKGEEGVDAGGLTREWFSLITKEIFNPDYVLFEESSESLTYQPNPCSKINSNHLDLFRIVGLVIGKCVLDGQVLDAFFTQR